MYSYYNLWYIHTQLRSEWIWYTHTQDWYDSPAQCLHQSIFRQKIHMQELSISLFLQHVIIGIFALLTAISQVHFQAEKNQTLTCTSGMGISNLLLVKYDDVDSTLWFTTTWKWTWKLLWSVIQPCQRFTWQRKNIREVLARGPKLSRVRWSPSHHSSLMHQQSSGLRRWVSLSPSGIPSLSSRWFCSSQFPPVREGQQHVTSEII